LMDHTHYMKAAFAQGEKALQVGEVPVGCVIVRENEIIASGYNRTNETRNATRHAELEAIDKLGKSVQDSISDILKGSVLYVTCEPCIMCAYALSIVNIGLVVYGCSNERFGGCGSVLDVTEVAAPTYESIAGIMKDEAISMLKKFYEQNNTSAPITPNGKRKAQ